MADDHDRWLRSQRFTLLTSTGQVYPRGCGYAANSDVWLMNTRQGPEGDTAHSIPPAATKPTCQGSDKPGAHAVVVPLTHRPRTARLRADRNADLVKPPVEDIIRDFGIVWHQVAPQLGSRTRPG